MNIMNEIASPIPLSPNNINLNNLNSITNLIQLEEQEQTKNDQLENSKIILNTLLKEITKDQQNEKTENASALKANNFTETLPVFLYEFFVFELYTPNEIFKTLRQPILAFRLLDFPTLSIEGRLDSQKNLVIFNAGKSSFFEMELGILKDLLTNEPLYVMFIDLNFGDMRIIGSSRVNISIFNHEHFLDVKDKERKFPPKPRRNLLKLFDKSQTVVAEFDISLLIKREFFKYDSKKEILDKLNLDGNNNDIGNSGYNLNCNNHSNNINLNNDPMSVNYEKSQKISGFNNMQFNSHNNINDLNDNQNFINGNFASQSQNTLFNSNNNVHHNNHNHRFYHNSQANYPNRVSEDAVDEFIDYNYNQNQAKSINGNFKKTNPLSQSNTLNLNNPQSQSNFRATTQNNKFLSNISANDLNEKPLTVAKSLYNPNKENIQSLLNPSQGKSFVHNLKDLLDGGSKQPPPLYFNHKRKNEREEFHSGSAQVELFSGNNTQAQFIPVHLRNFNSDNYEGKFQHEKSKLLLNTQNNFDKVKDEEEDFINHGVEDKINSSSSKKSAKAENEEILKAKNANLRYNGIQENSEIKQSETTNYIKKPKTIPNREFKDKKDKKEIKLFDKNFEKYETKQKQLGDFDTHKSKKPIKDSSSEAADKSNKRVNKGNSANENQEENEYIKLYSKIKSEERLNKLKNGLSKSKKKPESKSKSKQVKKRNKSNSASDSASNSSEINNQKESSDYSSDSNSSSDKRRKKQKNKKSKSKSKIKDKVNKIKNKREKYESESGSQEDPKSESDFDKKRSKNRNKLNKDSKKQKKKVKDDSNQEESDEDYFVECKGKDKIKNKKAADKGAVEYNQNKFRKSFSHKINFEKASDESNSVDIREDKKAKKIRNLNEKTEKPKSENKYKSPSLDKKEKYTFRDNEEDSKMLMSSNNYIKTESNLETQMRKLDKNPGLGKSHNMNYEISNSNAFTINTHQMSNLLKSNSSNVYEKLKEKEQLMLKNLEIKSENSMNIMSNKNSIKEEITDNINYISNKSISIISEDKIYNNNYNSNNGKKSKDYSHKKSTSSSNSKNMKFNNINVNKSEMTIEEESNLNINNKSNLSRKYLMPQQKSVISNNSNIPEEYQDLQGNVQKVKTTEDNYDEYGQFDYDYNTSNSKIIPSQSNFIDEDIIEEDIK